MPSYVDGICGGTAQLSASSPSVTMPSPLFYHSSTFDVYTDCWWYVISEHGKESELSIRDLETENEYFSLYDHPSSRSSSYRVSVLRGNVSESTVTSTRGGLSVFFDDFSSGRNRRGFIAVATLIGN